MDHVRPYLERHRHIDVPAAAGNAYGNAKAASFMKVGSVYPIEFETRCRRDLSPLYRGGYSRR